MKETGMIFTTESVRAMLDGRKTQTRRVIKPQLTCHCDKPDWRGEIIDWIGYKFEGRQGWFCYTCGNGLKHIDEYSAHGIICPYGQVGDRLWFKERHKLTRKSEGVICEYISGEEIYYSWADIPQKQRRMLNRIKTWGKWRPAHFMYKFLAVHWGEITGVRVERLQEITPSDAIKEGHPTGDNIPRDGELWFRRKIADGKIRWFANLWDSLNAKRGYGWDTNPWVWVITFSTMGVRVK